MTGSSLSWLELLLLPFLFVKRAIFLIRIALYARLARLMGLDAAFIRAFPLLFDRLFAAGLLPLCSLNYQA